MQKVEQKDQAHSNGTFIIVELISANGRWNILIVVGLMFDDHASCYATTLKALYSRCGNYLAILD